MALRQLQPSAECRQPDSQRPALDTSSATQNGVEGRTACNPRQPVQQPDYDRKREQAESGIAVGSPSLDDVPRVLHTSNLLAKQSLVCDRRYRSRVPTRKCLEADGF